MHCCPVEVLLKGGCKKDRVMVESPARSRGHAWHDRAIPVASPQRRIGPETSIDRELVGVMVRSQTPRDAPHLLSSSLASKQASSGRYSIAPVADPYPPLITRPPFVEMGKVNPPAAVAVCKEEAQITLNHLKMSLVISLMLQYASKGLTTPNRVS